MSYQVIPIPGESTRYEDAPIIEIMTQSDEALAIRIKYYARAISDGSGAHFGVINFIDVLRFGWVDDAADLEAFDGSLKDFKFGLIEITDSPDVEALKIHYRNIHHVAATPRHFRIGFDDFGRIDIIAISLSVMEVDD
jgi:hypothetical protein